MDVFDLSGIISKRILSIISVILILIVSLLVISGCRNEEKPDETSTNPTESNTEEYISSTTTEPDTSTTESTTESTTRKKVVTPTKPVKPTESTTNDLPPYVSKIKIINIPTVTTYYVGDAFSVEGLKVQAYYINGTSADVTDAISFANDLDAVMSTPGVKRINVEYVDFDTNLATTFFTITVKEPPVTEPTEPTETTPTTEQIESTEPIETTENTEI